MKSKTNSQCRMDRNIEEAETKIDTLEYAYNKQVHVKHRR